MAKNLFAFKLFEADRSMGQYLDRQANGVNSDSAHDSKPITDSPSQVEYTCSASCQELNGLLCHNVYAKVGASIPAVGDPNIIAKISFVAIWVFSRSADVLPKIIAKVLFGL